MKSTKCIIVFFICVMISFFIYPGSTILSLLRQSSDWEVVYDFKDEGFFYSIQTDPENSSILYVTNQSGYYFSDDYGKTWVKKTNYGQINFVKPYKDNVYAGVVGAEYKNQRGLYISYDNGNTFSQISSPINQELKKESICPYDFEQNRKNRNILYFAHCYGLSTSTDKGKNWKTYKDLTKNYEIPFYSVATTEKKPETIICAGIDKWNNNAPYVIKSDNSGTNWKIIYQDKSLDESNGGNYSEPVQVEIDKINPKIFYLRVDKSNSNIPNDDFLFSINEGNTWKKIETPIPNVRINSICYSEALECLLASTSRGIYKFQLETEQWESIYFSTILQDNYGSTDLDLIHCASTEYGCDLYTANRTILYRLKIQSSPILSVSTDLINFGKVSPDDELEDYFSISNGGEGVLEGDISTNEDWISISDYEFSLESNEEMQVGINIDPTNLSPGKHTGLIDINSNVDKKTISILLDMEPADITGPMIKIYYPEDNYITNRSLIDIRGKVTDEESAVESLTINGHTQAFSKDGTFESKDNLLNEGNNKFTITATNLYSASTIYELHVIRDSIPPEIVSLEIDKDRLIQKNQEMEIPETIWVKSSKPTIKGTVEDGGSGIQEISCTINGEPAFVYLADDNTFHIPLVLEKETEIRLTLTDKAGNSKEFFLKVNIDFTVPRITLPKTLDDLDELVHTDQYSLQFEASDNGSGLASILLTDMGGSSLPFKENGSQYQASLPLQKGVNLFTITAIDNAGNETKQSIQLRYQPAVVITLTIGNSVATVQKNKDIRDIVMKVPPMIVKGTTFVPIRFIAETFGARVEWIPHPTNEIQIYFKDILIHLWINKTIGVVERGTETKKVTLLAAPFITNSTTMVPLRFISENLDAQVVWDAPTSTITIIQTVE